ncbi:Slp family lipoprotein [Paucibacter sp. O1-1]|nr:Slp family lipoprotein [Paucibacter sp. O1-1]MDA3827925.1 Slp family lipoprotein [Paucibacter sp. O1-1]
MAPSASPGAPTQGRFIILIPGYADRHDYPDGLFVSLTGRLEGTRVGRIQERPYVFPLVTPEHVHRWPPGFQFDHPQWHIGIGVGVNVR